MFQILRDKGILPQNLHLVWEQREGVRREAPIPSDYTGEWLAELLSEALNSAFESLLFIMKRICISVAYRFTDRNWPPTFVDYLLEYCLTVTWSSCYIHLFGWFDPSDFTTVLKGCCYLTSQIPSYPILLLPCRELVSSSIRFSNYWGIQSLRRTSDLEWQAKTLASVLAD